MIRYNENPKRERHKHLEGLEEGIDGLVSKNLGNDGVSGHSLHKLSLRQLVVLVPEKYLISFESFLFCFDYQCVESFLLVALLEHLGHDGGHINLTRVSTCGVN